MEKEENNYSAAFLPSSFNGLDYTLDHHHDEDQQLMNSSHVDQTCSSRENNNNGMVNYLMNDHHHDQLQLHQQPQQTTQPPPAGFGGASATSFDKLSFADVMQFADFGPKLALNQTKISEEESGIDPVYFLKFPVLNDNKLDEDDNQSLMAPRQDGQNSRQEERFTKSGEEEEARGVSGSTNSVQLQFLGDDVPNPRGGLPELPKNKRKRPRSTKTSQEVESQRMTHIAVERNRRKQMNEHLRVLRSLMPGSYVQRGDQASIIGGAIDFVRELEQLLQCLESQKRRRFLGETPPPRQVGADPAVAANMAVLPSQPDHQGSGGVPFFLVPNLPLNPNDPNKFVVDFEQGLQEETAESKSCFADVEVKVLGGDAMIKILSQRRPGQLIKAIAALEDLQLKILHTNITTIEQTVLYCFKVASESRFTAEDIASSVQQIFSFIHANTASM